MSKPIFVLITAAALGIAGCGEGEDTGGQIEKAAKSASDAVQNAAEKAGDKIEQWTDQPASDEKAGGQEDKAADRRGSE
ncbi:MAG: hypothetical protein ACREVE_15045 [Gammaproteobacteria bacterium]